MRSIRPDVDKHSSIGCVSLMICLAFAASLRAGPNLIRNPGFEEGVSPSYPGVGLYWETNDAQSHPDINELTTATKHGGSWSQHLRAHSQWDLGLVRQVSAYNSIHEGATYDISVWIKSQNIVNCAGWYLFGVWWFNGNDQFIGEAKMPQPIGCTCPRNDGCNHDWQLVTYSAVAPAGARRVAAVLTRHTDGDAWYDDVSITERSTLPSQIALAPASFTRAVRFGGTLADDTFTVQNSGGGELNYQVGETTSWLSVSPVSGSSTGEADAITLSYAPGGLSLGTHQAVITVTDASAGNSPQMLPVALNVRMPGDFDDDLDVDLDDFGRFQACLGGAGVIQTNPECAPALLDADLDVDGDDTAVFRGCLSGPGVTGTPSCAN